MFYAFIFAILIIVIIALIVNRTPQDRFTLIPSEIETKPRTSPSMDGEHIKAISSIQNSDIRSKPLLNGEEKQIFHKVFAYFRSSNVPYYIHAQVSLGEIIKSNEYAYKLINSKRVDFCVVDGNFNPVCVIEYQGSGHFNDSASKRDEIKKVACEKAGIKYIALYANSNITDILNMHLVGKLN